MELTFPSAVYSADSYMERFVLNIFQLYIKKINVTVRKTILIIL